MVILCIITILSKRPYYRKLLWKNFRLGMVWRCLASCALATKVSERTPKYEGRRTPVLLGLFPKLIRVPFLINFTHRGKPTNSFTRSSFFFFFFISPPLQTQPWPNLCFGVHVKSVLRASRHRKMRETVALKRLCYCLCFILLWLK